MGFLGMFNYSKPGKGISKNGPEKKRFFEFFDVYFRNFGRILKLHFLHLLFCIPIVTIGPATVALVKILHCYINEKPVFLFSDFVDEFKKNFKQGFFLGIINIAMGILIYIAVFFYLGNLNQGLLMYAALGMILVVTLIFTFTTYYSYMLVALVNMKLFHVLKNSFLLAFLGMGSNFITLISAIIICIPAAFIFLIFPPFIFIVFPTAAIFFIATFNSFQHIYRYVIKPFYELTGAPNPYEPEEYEDEEMIFEDASDTEIAVMPQKTSGKSGKTIS